MKKYFYENIVTHLYRKALLARKQSIMRQLPTSNFVNTWLKTLRYYKTICVDQNWEWFICSYKRILSYAITCVFLLRTDTYQRNRVLIYCEQKLCDLMLCTYNEICFE